MASVMPKSVKEISVLLLGILTLILSGCGDNNPLRITPISAKVLVSPTSGTVGPGETFTRTVEVKNVGSTFYAAFDLTYDPNVIKYISVTEGAFLGQNGSGSTSFQAALQDGKAGTLTIGLTRLGAIGEVSGSGTLLTLTFRAVGSGTAQLVFADRNKGLKNSAHQDVVIDSWENGTVTVQ